MRTLRERIKEEMLAVMAIHALGNGNARGDIDPVDSPGGVAPLAAVVARANFPASQN